MNISAKLFSPTIFIVLPTMLLVTIGLASIREAAPLKLPDGGGLHALTSVVLKSFLGKQCVAAVIGFVAAWLVSRSRPSRVRSVGYSLYGACLAVLAILFVLGRVRNGARSWFVLGPVSIQPSEFMKLAFVLTLARFLMWRKAPDRWARLMGPAAIVGVPFLIILLQPDLGTALIFPSMFISMMWVAGMKKRHLFLGAMVVLVVTPLAYKYKFKEYQKKRFEAFLHPQEMKQDAGYQLYQSQKAIGSGGWTGRGVGESDQDGPARFVPERHNDFIFAVIGDEWGFLGASAVLGLYFVLLIAMVLGAFRAREPFSRLVLTGLSAGFATQIFVNIGMTMGLAPITGITLPFLSYGGSSMVATLVSVGVAWNISGQPQLTMAGRDFREGASEVLDMGTDEWKR